MMWFLVGVMVGVAFLLGKLAEQAKTEERVERIIGNFQYELEWAHEEGVKSAVRDRFGDFEEQLRLREQAGWDKGFNAGYEEALEDQ